VQVLSDYVANTTSNSNDQQDYPHALRGDFLCLAGAALYATSNVGQEVLVKKNDPVSIPPVMVEE